MKENQFNLENEVPVFEGQPIEQPSVVSEGTAQMEKPEVATVATVQSMEQEVAMPEFTQQPEFEYHTELMNETQVYQAPLFDQTISENVPFGTEMQYSQPLQNAESFLTQQTQYSQPNMFVANGAPVKRKSKKKLITIIVSLLIVLVLLVLGGLYGYSVYTKSQALETTKNERNTIKKEVDELQKKVTKLESLDKLKDFEMCVYEGNYSGVDSGRAFHFTTTGSYEISEKTEAQFKEMLSKCEEKTEGVKLEGAEEKVDAEIKKIEEAYTKNSKFLEEGKTALNQWNAFKGAWKTGLIEEAEFNHIRDLAASAMGVDPSTIGSGNRLVYYEVAKSSFSRMNAIEEKQTSVSSLDFKTYLSESTDGEYYANFKDSYEEKQTELKNVQKSLDKKEKEVKEKESKLWNPFQ